MALMQLLTRDAVALADPPQAGPWHPCVSRSEERPVLRLVRVLPAARQRQGVTRRRRRALGNRNACPPVTGGADACWRNGTGLWPFSAYRRSLACAMFFCGAAL